MTERLIETLQYSELLRKYRETWDVHNPDQVMPTERFWVVHYVWLKTRGYLLRPRYNPEWIPSWKGTKKRHFSCEDGVESLLQLGRLLDAIRISDGKSVALKLLFESKHPYEAELSAFLSSEPLASDPTNHCIPIFEILEVPNYGDMIILVMPFLRQCNDPRFETIGEAVEFFRQVFEGLQFMHKRHVAHRDCTKQNIMMDPGKLYPEWCHPVHTDRCRSHKGYAKHYTRTERPPKYLLIDFGLSRRYGPKDGPPCELSIRGGDKTVPEYQGEKYHESSNPFPHIYYLGNMIKEYFMDKAFGFDFMWPLVSDMVQEEPSMRPTIDEVAVRFDSIYRSLSTTQLRSRAVKRNEEDVIRLLRNWRHFFRRLRFILLRIPPVPRSGTKHPAFTEVGLRPLKSWGCPRDIYSLYPAGQTKP